MENYKNSKAGREAVRKYGDILEMERPQTEEALRTHPRAKNRFACTPA